MQGDGADIGYIGLPLINVDVQRGGWSRLEGFSGPLAVGRFRLPQMAQFEGLRVKTYAPDTNGIWGSKETPKMMQCTIVY